MGSKSIKETRKNSCGLDGVNGRFCLDGDATALKQSILDHLHFTLARHESDATQDEWWLATCHAIKDRLLDRFMKTQRTHNKIKVRRAYYLSMEYLMGRLLTNNLYNSGFHDMVRDVLTDMGQDFDAIVDVEPDMGLGNGGLGRLAACFLDSLATMDLPAIGYGIHYRYGLFRQEFLNGHQVEEPDTWTEKGCPWEIQRPLFTQKVKLYGRVSPHVGPDGKKKSVWLDYKTIDGVPYDLPIVGHGGGTVNFLRLWESVAGHKFDLEMFNQGSYVEAVREKSEQETISKVLYPNDSTEAGKELRLIQQYFFVTCSLQDIIRRHFRMYDSWDSFDASTVIQLNDTHPAIAVVELMRLLIDDNDFTWDAAWALVRKVLNYTNHTLLPEALEQWSVGLFEKILPRHLEIIYEVNHWFLNNEVEAKWPNDDAMKRELSIIQEGEGRSVRMAFLSVVASKRVNGVAALHTELLKRNLFSKFNELYPNKFINVTNGITPRRWLLACNPGLSALINRTLGSNDWTQDLEALRGLEAYAEDANFQEEFMGIKRSNKQAFANLSATVGDGGCGIEISPDALFDVQIKRLHEYKRQHLNLLHILTLYRRLLSDPNMTIVPRVFIFGAKAAPGYTLAKCIIRAINKVAERINHDPRIKGMIKIVFPENYRVTLAEKMIPAADLSEQISTAGKEASGTGNMKLSLNGALTIGTLDGANVEIKDAVGDENIFIFGNTVQEVEALKQNGYNPYDFYNNDWELREVINWLRSDFFTPGEHDAFAPICDSLLDHGDPFMVLADYADYVRVQSHVDEAYANPKKWAKMAIINTARMGYFSSDRTIGEYSKNIWKLKPVKVID